MCIVKRLIKSSLFRNEHNNKSMGYINQSRNFPSRNLKTYHRQPKSPPLKHTLNQVNQFHIL